MNVEQVRFQLLGPFEVSAGGRPVPVGGPTAQAVLVGLVHRAGQTVLGRQVVDLAWGDPQGATDDSLYHYIGKLRRWLEPAGVRIESCWPGYRLVPPPQAVVDSALFAELVTAAQAVRGTEPEQAATRLRAALDLWQGDHALAGLNLAGSRRIAARLDELRLHAAELLAELELQLGNPDQVLARVRGLAGLHPGSGRLVAAVMRALQATGRSGEALGLYRRAEQHARRLGREAPEAVRRAHAEAPAGQDAPPNGGEVPFQLPADTSHFTGRSAEMERLRALWPDDGSIPSALVVSAVDGMAGIGKTALAVHAAHELADRFPDGNLFIDLHGFTPDTRPQPPEKALDILLRGLGVTGQQIPRDLEARAALYRSRLARRRMLIVLDNARDETQVRPLLPGTTSCLVIVTSRRRLAGLDDATHLTLDTLTPDEAAALFRAVASDRATAGDHHVINQIVRTCGELPLAIRIAAARLRISRAMSPSTLLNFLRSGREDRRLAGLDDGERSVNAVIAVSLRHLAPEQGQAFAQLSAHPGPHFDAYAAAALLDTSLDQARHLLDTLEQVNLISQPAAGRYRYHDLLRAYATDPASPLAEAVPDRGPALRRLLDHYAHTTSLAMDALYPYDSPYRPRIPTPPTPAPPLAGDPDRAAAWLNAELPNLLAAAHHAAAHPGGHPGHVLHLSATLARYLLNRARRSADAHALHAQALDVARRTGDRPGEVAALNALARTDQVAGNHPLASQRYRLALTAAEHLADPHGQLTALVGLAHVARLTGHDRHAYELFARALTLARRHGHARGEIDAHWGLGQLHRWSDRPREAAEEFAAALRQARRINHHRGEVRALVGLGSIQTQLGTHTKANNHLGHALHLAEQIGDISGQINALCGLGHVARLRGQPDLATGDYQRALDLARDTGDRTGRFEALHGLGHTLRHAGHPDRALSLHAEALELATTLGQPRDQARAHDGLAHAHRDLGHPDRARTHWHHALDTLRGTDTARHTRIHDHLARLAAHPHPGRRRLNGQQE